jgi:hypothetical protein
VQRSQVEKYTPLAARVRARREAFLFLEIADFFGGGSSEAAMGGGGEQRPVGRGNELKKTVARSAQARTRCQNPLVIKNLKKFRQPIRYSNQSILHLTEHGSFFPFGRRNFFDEKIPIKKHSISKPQSKPF